MLDVRVVNNTPIDLDDDIMQSSGHSEFSEIAWQRIQRQLIHVLGEEYADWHIVLENRLAGFNFYGFWQELEATGALGVAKVRVLDNDAQDFMLQTFSTIPDDYGDFDRLDPGLRVLEFVDRRALLVSLQAMNVLDSPIRLCCILVENLEKATDLVKELDAALGLYRQVSEKITVFGAGPRGCHNLGEASVELGAVQSEWKAPLLADMAGFFKSGELFRSRRLPYRRSVLLGGLPGNGKTSLSRALAAYARETYKAGVVSWYIGRNTGHGALASVSAELDRDFPMILLIEDVDVINEAKISRAELLGALEYWGRYSAYGVYVMATTNHPEVIDPAMQRPGRFDRIITMANPSADERHAFIRMCFEPLLLDGSVDDAALKAAAVRVGDLSYAAIQELYVHTALAGLENGGDYRAALRGAVKAVRASEKLRLSGEYEAPKEFGFGRHRSVAQWADPDD